MSHEIHEDDRVFFGGNVPAWHGLGTVIERDTVTTDEAIEILGLDWEVVQKPHEIIGLDGQPLSIDRKFQNHRSTDGKYLGTVGAQYKTFQNQQAFAFGDAMAADHGAKWHTGGTLFDCKQAWMLMKLPQDVYIAGEDSEQIQPFICFKNSHDGSCAVTMFTTFTRVVCNNTLGFALRGTQRKHTIRHTGNFNDPEAMAKYVLQAQEKLGVVFDLIAQLEREGAQLMRPRASRFTVDQFDSMLDVVIGERPDEDNYEEEKHYKKAKTAHDGRRELYVDYFRDSPNLGNVRNTKWGALQAIIEVADHRSIQRDHKVHDQRDVRFDRIIEGQDTVQKAYDYLIAA
jgi:phage/plasmid-like protein (TIGR03299 family)